LLFANFKTFNLFLQRYNTLAAKQCYYSVTTQWIYSTNITQQNRDQLLNATEVFNRFQKQQSIEAKRYDWTDFEDNIQRQFEKIALIGSAVLEGNDGLTYSKVLNEMQTIYSTAKVCLRDKCGLELEPDLTQIMATSGNHSELLEAWVKWRDASGKQMRDKFISYYSLGNKAALLNELPNTKFETLYDLWLFQWETPDLMKQTYKLLHQLMPFYQKLHAYIRIRLSDALPTEMPADNTLPAHLLGNMWAQQWSHTMNTVEGVDPYPQIQTIDVSDALKTQVKQIFIKHFKHFSIKPARKMFELSNQFIKDLGLDQMTDRFWKNSVFEKPRDGTDMFSSHASAWDFYTTDDFRIKQCTRVDMESFIKMHHEMGHIEYYMQYKHQPIVFREGANPGSGFHEAIGDVLALSVSTPKHLNKIGLLEIDDSLDLYKINIKSQLKMALEKVVLLPFAYIMDKWRSDVFSGRVSQHNLNRHWWTLRGQYQGVSPPCKRSEQDFDPGAKFHIANSVEYIRYFVSIILQFQIHGSLCRFGQKDVPLYECDIDGDKEAGNKLKYSLLKQGVFVLTQYLSLINDFREVLLLGSSERWTKQLERLTGSQEMDVKPLLDYFKPLQDFLDQQLVGEEIGWDFKVQTLLNY
ncbi:unnamed protein product, partial [Medioppia subpectinata]